MHILIVTAHPDPASFTHAAVARFISGIETVFGTSHEVVDLIAKASIRGLPPPTTMPSTVGPRWAPRS